MPRIFYVCILIVFSSSSHAGFIKHDWQVNGDESIIFDDESNLEWLSLTETVGETYDYIETQFGVDGEYSGFRFASMQEVRSLVENAGSSWGYCTNCPENVAPMESLIKLIGSGYSYGSGITTWGYTQSDPSSMFFEGIMLTVDYNANVKGAISAGGFQKSNTYSNLGGFLVRTVEVPEPSTLFLLITSLVSMVVFRTRQLTKGEKS